MPKRRLAILAVVALPWLTGVALAACESKPEAPPQAAHSGPAPAELAAGERLFDASCARCHGQGAVGTEQGPPLVHIYYEPNHHGDVAFQRAVLLGVQAHHWNFGPMPQIEGVSEGEVAEITAYVRWLQRSAGIY